MKNAELFEKAFAAAPGPELFLSKAEAAVLWEHAGGEILEVGSYMGRSTTILAQLGHVHAVDPFIQEFDDEPVLRVMNAFLLNTKGMNVTHHPIRIEQFMPIKVDFAYLDGGHTFEQTMQQIMAAFACRADGIAVHDMDMPDVRNAAIEVMGKPDVLVERMAYWRVIYQP